MEPPNFEWRSEHQARASPQQFRVTCAFLLPQGLGRQGDRALLSPSEVPLGLPRAAYRHGLHKSRMEERTSACLRYREGCSAASAFRQTRETEAQAARGTDGRQSTAGGGGNNLKGIPHLQGVLTSPVPHLREVCGHRDHHAGKPRHPQCSLCALG